MVETEQRVTSGRQRHILGQKRDLRRPLSVHEFRDSRIGMAAESQVNPLLRIFDRQLLSLREGKTQSEPLFSPVETMASIDILTGVVLASSRDVDLVQEIYSPMCRLDHRHPFYQQGLYGELFAQHIEDCLRDGVSSPDRSSPAEVSVKDIVTVIRSWRNIALQDKHLWRQFFWFFRNPEAPVLEGLSGLFEEAAEHLLTRSYGRENGPFLTIADELEKAMLFIETVQKQGYKLTNYDIPTDHRLLLPFLEILAQEFLETHGFSPDTYRRAANRILNGYLLRVCPLGKRELIEVCQFFSDKLQSAEAPYGISPYLMLVLQKTGLCQPSAADYYNSGLPESVWEENQQESTREQRTKPSSNIKYVFVAQGKYWFMHFRHRNMLINAAEIIERTTGGKGLLVVAPNQRHPDFPAMADLALRVRVAEATLQGLGPNILLSDRSPNMGTVDKWEYHYPRLAQELTGNSSQLGRVIGYEHYGEYPELRSIPTICGIRSADLHKLPVTLQRIRNELDAAEPGTLFVTLPPCIDYSGTFVRQLAQAAIDGCEGSLQQLATMVHPQALPIILEAARKQPA